MKKIIFTLAVLLLAVPAMADVNIVCIVSGPKEVTVSFTSSEPNTVRGIALDIQVNDHNAWIENVSCISADYPIHPGSIEVDAGGNVTDYGTCAGVQDGNMMTSEQGSVYVGSPNSPLPGDLFIVTLGGCTNENPTIVSVTVSENALRGGVVMENPHEFPTVNLTGCSIDIGPCPDDCYLPNCCPTCKGDLNHDCWITVPDMFILMGKLGTIGAPFTIPMGHPLYDACGDMDDKGWIMVPDMFMLLGMLGTIGPPYQNQCPQPCQPIIGI